MVLMIDSKTLEEEYQEIRAKIRRNKQSEGNVGKTRPEQQFYSRN